MISWDEREALADLDRLAVNGPEDGYWRDYTADDLEAAIGVMRARAADLGAEAA